MSNDVTISYGLEYNVALLRKLVSEIKSRQKYLYYSYSPPSIKHSKFHTCSKKIRILKGAPRSGKTTCAIMDILKLALGEHEYYSHRLKPPCMIWIVVDKFKKVYSPDGMMFKIDEIMPKNRLKRSYKDKNKNEYGYEFDNGSNIIFKSQEEGSDAFRSVKIDCALIDERMDYPDMRLQIRTRIIDKDGLLIFTMDSFDNDEWISDLIGNPDLKKDVEYIELELKDNAKYLPKTELNRLEKELDAVGKERILYGRHKERFQYPLFPSSLWTESNYVEINPKRYDIVSDDYGDKGCLIANETGSLRMFKDVEVGKKYLLACDTAEGVGRNSHAIQIFDDQGEQCAMWLNNNVNYVLLADEVLIPLANYYNHALIIIENNYFGNSVIMKLMDGYDKIYYEIDANKQQNIIATNLKSSHIKYGIFTTDKNKPEMVNQTLDDLKNNRILLHDSYTLTQLKGFIKIDNDKDSRKSAGSKYRGTKIQGIPDLKYSDDDLVMSLLFIDRALNKEGIILRKRGEYKRLKEKESKLLSIDDLQKIEITRYNTSEINWYNY